MTQKASVNPGGPAEPGGRLPDPSQWVERYGAALYRYALFRVRDAAVAEELVQETFLAAWRGRDRFAGRSAAKTWLVGILKRKIVDHFRRENAGPAREGPGDADPILRQCFDKRGKWRVTPRDWGGDPAAELERREFWAVFQRCLTRLPAQQGDAFSLYELEGRSGKESREILHVTASNLWVLLHRARLRLARCLDLHWFGAAEKE